METIQNEKNDYERYFEWWLKALQEVGIVKEYQFEPNMFYVMEPLALWYSQSYKRKKPIVKDITMLQPLSYTPDFRVVFDARLLNQLFAIIDVERAYIEDDLNLDVGNVYQNTIFYGTRQASITPEGNYEIWFDVKQPAKIKAKSAKTTSSRDFRYLQRLMYIKHNIFINPVVVIDSAGCLFNKTFIPDRYLYTDGGTKVRKEKDYLLYRNMAQYLDLKNVKI